MFARTKRAQSFFQNQTYMPKIWTAYYVIFWKCGSGVRHYDDVINSKPVF